MRDWVVAKKNIFHKTKNFFTIIGVRVATKAREVSFWDQPLIMNKNISFAGFLVKKINFTTHYLVRFSLKPGLKKECLSCTVNTSDVYNYKKNKNLTVFSKFILKNFFLSNKKNNVKYDTIQSDEGGRFYQSQIRNMIIKIDNNQNISFDKGYKWISQNQMIYLIDKGLLDIEARLLFSCYNFDKII